MTIYRIQEINVKTLILIMIALSLSGCDHSISPGVQVHVTVGEGVEREVTITACPRCADLYYSYMSTESYESTEEYEELITVF